MYNILEWHWPGFIVGLSNGWIGELQCLTLSISAMTGGLTTSARAGNAFAEALTAVQSLIGLLMIVVFIAKAVSVLPSR